MNRSSLMICVLITVIFIAVNFTSCSKSSPDANPAPTDPCAGKTITLTLTPVASNGCSNNGSITASATGSTNFTFKLNAGGAYQASGTFSNIVPGTYSIFAKDGAGCEKTETVIVAGDGVKGPLFTAVRNLVTAKCQSCHNNTVQNGGQNWVPDCNIVGNQDRIRVRAVVEGTMPQNGPLTTAEKAVITNWINAGGRLTD